MTNDEGRKPERAPERSSKARVGAPSDVDGNGVSAGAKIPHWKRPNGSVAPE
jgi:hypothetical protein